MAVLRRQKMRHAGERGQVLLPSQLIEDLHGLAPAALACQDAKSCVEARALTLSCQAQHLVHFPCTATSDHRGAIGRLGGQLKGNA